jgi:alpha,alpha-trehalose-phosphate synthase [UDP-forming]/trehalose-phosphatase
VTDKARAGDDGHQRPIAGKHDLVVVANRLPVDRRELPDGTVEWQPSPGGLVAALEPVMQRNDGAWIGWTGAPGDAPEPFEADGIHLVPVQLDEADVENFYEGMSNGTLWPLYHDVIARPEFHRHWWEAYVRVNRRFAEAAVREASDGALVWVQDYQLQLVPQMLRERRPDLRIGFFNHIPFPPYEIFAQLPWRRQVLEGLLGADQLGFQRPADANNFLRACRRNGLATRRGMVQLPPEPRFGSPDYHPRREVRAAPFPISIDAQRIEAMARDESIRERAREIRRELGDPRVLLLGVDRLDYTKGILHRLKAFEELLEDGRLSADDAVLVQVATPSRERVEEYRRMREDVEVTVGRINGDYGQLGRPAVHYLHQAYPRHELAALYLAADVLLVTALRDGMNLVAKEYVASRFDERGALVLSEFAGAAIELPQAFLVNPHDIAGLKAAIMNAVEVTPQEAQRRMRAMRRRVFEYDVARWASTFLRVASGRITPDAEGEPDPPRSGGGGAGPSAASVAAAATSTAGALEAAALEGAALGGADLDEALESGIASVSMSGSGGRAAKSRMRGRATASAGSTALLARSEAGEPDVDGEPEPTSSPGPTMPSSAFGTHGISGGPAVSRPMTRRLTHDPAGAASRLPAPLVAALERFVTHEWLLIGFDFDGVLAPLVADPHAARILPAARRPLTTLAGLPGIRLALVSGRALADLRRVASPPPGVLLAGSHGAEIVDPDSDDDVAVMLDEARTALLQRMIEALQSISVRHDGTHVELKPAGAVLHTRRAAPNVGEAASREALQGPATWPGVHLTLGKEVVELSVLDTGKGSALNRMRAATRADAVLYAGDDTTDERAFAVLDDDAGDVTVKVGPGDTLARHRVNGPDDVAAILELLVDLCQE